MQPTPQTKVSILRLENPLKIIFIVGLCLFSMCGNVLQLGVRFFFFKKTDAKVLLVAVLLWFLG
jgi:hypothetical protein